MMLRGARAPSASLIVLAAMTRRPSQKAKAKISAGRIGRRIETKTARHGPIRAATSVAHMRRAASASRTARAMMMANRRAMARGRIFAVRAARMIVRAGRGAIANPIGPAPRSRAIRSRRRGTVRGARVAGIFASRMAGRVQTDRAAPPGRAAATADPMAGPQRARAKSAVFANPTLRARAAIKSPMAHHAVRARAVIASLMAHRAAKGKAATRSHTGRHAARAPAAVFVNLMAHRAAKGKAVIANLMDRRAARAPAVVFVNLMVRRAVKVRAVIANLTDRRTAHAPAVVFVSHTNAVPVGRVNLIPAHASRMAMANGPRGARTKAQTMRHRRPEPHLAAITCP